MKGMVQEFEEIAVKLDEMKSRVESRIKFLIINIQERRAKGWEEGAMQADGPKTVKALHQQEKQAAEERMQSL